MGAHVTRIERPGPKDSEMEAAHTILKRERDTVADLIRGSDIVLEGFRPGVVKKLGLNPAVVYERMTGWGQSAPTRRRRATTSITSPSPVRSSRSRAATAHPCPRSTCSVTSGGGALYMVAGVLVGLYRARLSGTGTVLDAAIVDGVAHPGTASTAPRTTGLSRSARSRRSSTPSCCAFSASTGVSVETRSTPCSGRPRRGASRRSSRRGRCWGTRTSGRATPTPSGARRWSRLPPRAFRRSLPAPSCGTRSHLSRPCR